MRTIIRLILIDGLLESGVLIIAIDGPAGVGKSTVAKLLASRLGYLYLDTGALYRAVAWKALRKNVNPEDSEQISHLLPTTSIQMQFQHGSMQVLVDGHDITAELRGPDVTASASIVSAIPAVREWLLPIQRQIGQRGSVVAEGREWEPPCFHLLRSNSFWTPMPRCGRPASPRAGLSGPQWTA